jgi:putative FmdB family regulatory protein
MVAVMPFYEFQCAACGARAEVFARRMTDDVPTPACPSESSSGHEMRRVVSRFAQHLDMATKLAEAEATYGKEVNAVMGPEPDVGRFARRFDTIGKDLPPSESAPPPG